VGVPRLFNRLHDKIRGGVAAAGGVKSMLFERAYASKLSSLRASGSLTSALWDRLVFGKIAGVLGGRVRLVVTGSAPIAANVLEFLRIVLSCPVIEGYGLTETTAAATVTLPKDVNSCGHVGVPLICNEVKLVDVPEMGFTAQDTTKGEPTPRGEIWIRGSNVFKGYYKNAEQTAASITPDGWFKTGDVGMWLRDGSLKIVGRKKDNFKLAQGEYIAPEKVENVYLRCKYVAQIFVYGDSLRSCLVAVVVPDEEQVRAWAKAASVAATEWPQLVKHPDLAGVVLKAMDKVADQERLNGFERVKAIALVDQPFSVDNGLLTPTLKLKRPAAEKAFKDIVTALYAQVDEKDAKAPKIKSKL
jgi:long-chain acyl-CoA synthetase